jgi:hypothetical protein
VNQEPEDMVRRWVAQFDERLGWLDQTIPDFTTPQLVAVISSLEERQRKLNDYLSMMKDAVVVAMDASGNKQGMATALDGAPLAVTASRKPRRSKVDRDGLYNAVRKHAQHNRNMDETTGEIESLDACLLRLIDRSFRLEPRWSELAKLNIDGDEFCETEWSNSLKIERGATL